jgi:hypothetical protein
MLMQMRIAINQGSGDGPEVVWKFSQTKVRRERENREKRSWDAAAAGKDIDGGLPQTGSWED